ncbi:MAG: tetraacyldisaccharide 4'-kinase [Dinghuibacter sp.]|nr:tetraacyldisaccharide 4'-kinase [Dinghuibacter sp.]
MFSSFLLRSFRILLFPFALLYGAGVWVRNWLYDKKVYKSASFNLPLICVGNLAVGGTGKSPMVEFLVKRLKQRYKLAILSRGYRRKTKGYILAGSETTANELGDEPFMFHTRFPDVPVAVGEERVYAIPMLLHDKPGTQAIILDDAFQHREVTAGLNLLLTDYHNLYSRDFFLPTGDLRDARNSAKRAQVVMVTKCPEQLTREESIEVRQSLRLKPEQQLFFSTIAYHSPYHLLTRETISLQPDMEALLVTGIAKTGEIKKYLGAAVQAYNCITYRDHHIFDIDDLRQIKKEWAALGGKANIIVTTEKDAVRLLKFGKELDGLPIYVLPIETRILFGEEEKLVTLVTTFINSYEKG